MIDPHYFYRAIETRGSDFFTGVPDSLLKDLCSCITDNTPTGHHVIAANEGGAIAIALGYHLASGKLPVVYMQNSGLGNTINPLLSLADPEIYGIPMLLILGWRGEPGVKDEPQHVKQGRVTPTLLEAMEIPFIVIGANDGDTIQRSIDTLIAQAQEQSRPVALLVRKNTFGPYVGTESSPAASLPMTREQSLGIVLSSIEDDAVIVATTGMTSRELFELRAEKKQPHDRDFLTVGGMGHASQIALGIALAQPERKVYCLDGDGAVLMHMGALAINASVAPSNYRHIVLNNGAHDSVGGQPTIGFDIDMCELAASCGYSCRQSVADPDALRATLTELTRRSSNAVFLEVRVRKGARAELGRPTTTPADNKANFMAFLAR